MFRPQIYNAREISNLFPGFLRVFPGNKKFHPGNVNLSPGSVFYSLRVVPISFLHMGMNKDLLKLSYFESIAFESEEMVEVVRRSDWPNKC